MKEEPIYVADSEEEAELIVDVLQQIAVVRGGKSRKGETIHLALSAETTRAFKSFQLHLNAALRMVGLVAPHFPEDISQHHPYFVRYEAIKDIHLTRAFRNGKTIFAELRDEDTEESDVEINSTPAYYSELNTQIGGDHYAKCAIQPIDYIMANGLDYLQGNVIKYVTRYKNKNGVEDLEKAAHYLRIMIEREKAKDASNT